MTSIANITYNVLVGLGVELSNGIETGAARHDIGGILANAQEEHDYAANVLGDADMAEDWANVMGKAQTLLGAQ